MSSTANVMKRTRQSGQTLIIALLIMGVLLILGFVFLGLISRNIATGVRSNQRSIGNDLAEAGIRYAHGQLLRSGLGADWRVTLTPGATNRDPDYDYLQPNGPDGLGNYGRVNYDQGRALVRVRYGPTEMNMWSNNPAGPLISPGKAKNYVIIESIGKPGKVNTNDPTMARNTNGQERERLQTRKLIAFASIGITEQAFFVTNKHNSSRPIDFGFPDNLGATYRDLGVGIAAPVMGSLQLGDEQLLPDKNGGFSLQPYGGGAHFNGAVNFHGNVRFLLNRFFGEAVLGNDTFLGVDDVNSTVNILGTDINPAGNWVPFAATLANASATSLDSRSPLFSTAGNVFRDGMSTADRFGVPRGNRRKEPPSFLGEDSSSGELIYRTMTRDSGIILAGGNSGIYGHGRSVYVNNESDRQNRADEKGREIQETAESLVFDWLNPNNGQAGSGWQGAFYVPRGAYVQLLPDGFLILRDSRGAVNERTWRDPQGNDSTNSMIRYRVGAETVNGVNRLFIINSVANPAEISQANPDYRAGLPFDGVLFFEGNARVRGTIPTDVQLTLVSGGTIYIEGSITKGIIENQVSSPALATATGLRLNRSSRSMLMLAAKDFVALNTSQFFGPAPSQVIEEVNDLASASEYNAIRMRRQATPGTPSTYLFRGDMLLNPQTQGANPANPSLWKPYSTTREFIDDAGTTRFLDTSILMTHTMDDGPATNSFLSLDINFGLGGHSYLFDLEPASAFPSFNLLDPFQVNNAPDYAPYNLGGYIEPGYGAATADRGPIYGIGAESWQRYSRFETTAFPIARSAGAAAPFTTFPVIPQTPEHGNYQLLAQETNDFNFRFNDIGTNASNDYLIARAAMLPNDVRIEASIFAEEGSFFVIPGSWFNPNPNDRRDAYLARLDQIQAANPSFNEWQTYQAAAQERYENYGSSPGTPFYGEPLDVKVRIIGAVSQNMPAPMSQQAEWLKKWGWIPRRIGDARVPDNAANPNNTTDVRIPNDHVPGGVSLDTSLYVPNLIISYDPALGSGRAWDPAFLAQGPFYWQNPAIRTDPEDPRRMLPPMPRLPVSPTLAYFGEVNQ